MIDNQGGRTFFSKDGDARLQAGRSIASRPGYVSRLERPGYRLLACGPNQAAKSWRAQEVNGHRVATLNRGDNFGLVTIDWDQPDPRNTLQIRDVTGDAFLAQKLNLGTLRRRAPRAAR
jgi:hypothetical protein